MNKPVTKPALSYRLLEELIDSIEDGAAFYDSGSRLVRCNAQYRKNYPGPEEGLTEGASFRDIMGVAAVSHGKAGSETDIEAWLNDRVMLFEEGVCAYEVKRIDGIWFRIDYYKLDSGGTFVITSDITEKKTLENDLTQSQNRLCAIFDNAPMEISLKDRDGRYILINKRLESAFNRPAGEIHGLLPTQIHEPGRARRVIEHDQKVLQDRKPHTREEQIETANGLKTRHFTKFPVFDENGAVDGLGTIMTDVTQLKESEVRLRAAKELAEQADLAKSEFLATMSHELRTPLTSIKGCLGLLDGIMADDLSSDARSLLDIAGRNCETLVMLINDLLDVEKIISGTMSINQTPQNVGVLVQGAIEGNWVFAEIHSVKFVLREPENPVWASLDEYRFAQIMRNLLSNAAKFSQSGADINIYVAESNEQVTIKIEDFGIGIPEGLGDRIFERFIQADSSDTRQQSGTGLGLAITKALVDAMEGDIRFTSEINKGTTFTVSFPVIENVMKSQ